MELNVIYRTTKEITPMPKFDDKNTEDRKTPFKTGTDFWLDEVSNGVVVVEAKNGNKYSFLEDEFSERTEKN
jgi:hypothetical protein